MNAAVETVSSPLAAFRVADVSMPYSHFVPRAYNLAKAGDKVRKGDPVGQIHFPERPEREPVIYRAGTSGTLIGRTHKVLVGPGDFLALIAHDL